MATHMTLLLLLVPLIAASATHPDILNNTLDLSRATEEMTRANYFTFVMLINMSPPDRRIEANVTFLMPNDRTLSKVRMPQNSALNFLLHHSVPLPLLFDHLQHIPSGSVIPSSQPEYMLKVYNKGRRNFYLNNVKIISPNLCTAGSSIRCHGIDGVLTESINSPFPSCSNSSGPAVAAAPPAPLPSPPAGEPSQFSMAAPPVVQAVGPHKSGSCCHSECRGLLKFLVTSVVMLFFSF